MLKTKAIVLIGPPGSGKGTQSGLLSEKFKMLHISTGDLCREEAANKTELGRTIQNFIHSGDFVPDEFIIELIRKRVREGDVGEGVILDGFPRTVQQAREVVGLFDIDRVILLDVSDQYCEQRIKGRRVDPITARLYNIHLAPPTDTFVAQRLVAREMDCDAKVIRMRLKTYRAHLPQILEFFGNRIQVVNGERTIEEVSGDVQKAILEPLPAGGALGEEQCVICMTNPADTLISPCGHQCGCQGCLSTLHSAGGKCPICRHTIERVVRVYKAGVVDTPTPTKPPTDKNTPKKPTTPLESGWEEQETLSQQNSSLDAFENAISEQFQIEVAPSKGLRDGKKSSVGVTIGIPDLQNRVPVDVCCVVDISGSMGEDARFQDPENENLTRSEGISILDLVKHSVKAIMHTLTDQDRLSVVAFDSNAKIAVPLKEMTENGRKLAITALEKLRPEDNTNIWAGLYSGLEALRNPPKSTLINTAIPRKKTIILLTDGQPNQSPPEGEGKALFKYFEKYPDFKCQVNTFGFGYTLNSRLLLDIATVGSGTFAFIPDAKIVGTCFVSAVANLCSNLSQYCKVHLVLKNGATFAGPVSGNYSFQDTAWGRVVDIGPLYYGQNRDLSVPIHIPHSGEPYLDVTVEYDKSSGGTHKITYTASNRQPTSNSRAAVLRNKVVSNLIAIVDKCEKGNGLQAVQDMNTLSKKLADLDYANPLSENADNRLVALHDDVTGRMAKAISTVQRFKRWGKHYLLAITRSHQLQIKTNFMDPGLQVYGGSLFARLEDEGGKIFVTLPMKKTAAYHTQYIGGGVVGASTISTSTTPTAPTISPHTAPAPAPAPVQQANYTYYAGSGGGCFDAKCASVVIKKDSNGALEEVETHLDQLKKNDVVKVVNEKGEVGIATILCVVQIKLNLQAQNSLIQLNNGLKITKNHPIRVNGKWIKPKDHPEAVLVSSSSPYVYNFVLDRSHILLVNNTECCTFGHNIKDEVTYHPFYATNTVIETLSRLDGWEDGLVIVPRSLRSYHNTTNNYPALPRLQVSL